MSFLSRLAARMKSIYRSLKESYVNQFPAGDDAPYISRSSFRIGNHTLVSKTLKEGEAKVTRISLAAPRLLPTPLEITKTGSSRIGLRFSAGDAALMNRLAGRDVFDGGAMRDLKTLDRCCRSFTVNEDGIDALLPGEGGFTKWERTQKAMARLADRLREIGETIDLRLFYFSFKVRHGRDLFERKTCLRLLLKHYGKDHPAVREILLWAVEEGDFEIGYRSAEAMGMDTVRFTFSKAETGDVPVRTAAVRKIGEKRMPGGIEFLLGLFPETDDALLKIESLGAFRAFADPRAEPLLLDTLRAGPGELKAAALDALAACGGRDSLEPLYAVSADHSLPRNLRDAAVRTMNAVRGRLGESDSGLLSLAGGETAGGKLSVAEEEPGRSDAGGTSS